MFNHTKRYTVHVDPAKNHPYENPVFIKEGFSWPAFIFPISFFWALNYRLWAVAVGTLGIYVLVQYASLRFQLNPFTAMAIMYGFYFLIASEANDLRRESLGKRGYILSDIVTGDNELRAQQRFFERHFPSNTQPSSARKGTTSRLSTSMGLKEG